MIRRLFQQVWLLLASLAVTASAAPAAARDAPQRIVAVGDLHGDWNAWLAIARSAGLVDGRNRWTGGRTTLVQLGDVPDRGPDSLKIIEHLRRLQRTAPRSGGRVVALVGNHEAMNVIGDLRYVHPGEYAAFADRRSASLRENYYDRNRAAIEAAYRANDPKLESAAIRQAFVATTPLGKIEHQIAWSPGGDVGRWIVSNPAVAKIGGTLFVHGGLSAEYAGLSIAEINRQVAAALEARDQALTSIISNPLGPLWYRGNVTRAGSGAEGIALLSATSGTPPAPRPSIEDELGAVLQAYGARRIVVGHTPNLAGIAVDHGGRLIRADTGISSHYGGQIGYVEIIGDRVIPHQVARPAAGR